MYVDDARRRALDYPYAPIAESCTLRSGQLHPFDPEHTEGRYPVLAIGSNRAPLQLRRKFPEAIGLPIERVQLDGYDVVYGARVSGYGAIPATLIESPGTRVEVAITWLSDDELTVMDASEGLGVGYHWYDVETNRVVAQRPLSSPKIGAYVAAKGVWASGHGPVALRGVTASGRRFPAWNSARALETLGRQWCPAETADSFIERLVSDSDFRTQIRGRMGTTGLCGPPVPAGVPLR
jgi:hypothetical protein